MDCYGYLIDETCEDVSEIDIKSSSMFSMSSRLYSNYVGKRGNKLKPPIKRHDPLLVECVETLGHKASTGELDIVEIPGNIYRIVDYDGVESVETPETILWTIIV